MKTILLLALLFSISGYSQSVINASNYYEFYSKGQGLKGKKLTTAWLTEAETLTVLNEEMEKAGFEWVSNYAIIKIDSATYVSSICYSEKSNFGFLYEGSHSAFPKKSDKEAISLYKSRTGYDYSEKIIDTNGESEFIKIKTIPSNFRILKNDPYWYQYTENPKDNGSLVTREIIIAILREDIKAILKQSKH